MAAFDRTNERAVRWAQREAGQLVVGVTDSSLAAIRRAVSMALDEGVAPRRLARVLRDVVGLTERDARAVMNMRARLRRQGVAEAIIDRRASKYADKLLGRRALLIARTETMRAANAGQRELWQQAIESGQLPADAKRVWITAGDSRVRDSHAALEGSVTGVNEPFEAGIEPGEEVGCRCGHGIASGGDVERWRARSEPLPGPEGSGAATDSQWSSATRQQKLERLKQAAGSYGIDPKSVKLASGERTFTVGGKNFTEGGSYDPLSGTISVRGSYLDKSSASGALKLLRHESSHHMHSRTVTEAYLSPYRSKRKQAPPASMALAERISSSRAALEREDGITPYSTAYWNKYAADRTEANFRSAVDETLAEHAKLYGFDTPSPAGSSPLWSGIFNEMVSVFRGLK